MLERCSTSVESAEEIDIDDRLERVRGHAKRRCREVSGSAADDQIDFAMRVARSLDCAGECVVIPDIGWMSGCNASCFANLVRGSIEFLTSPADQRNPGAVLGESLRDGEIDPASATSDDGGLSIEHFLVEDFRHRRTIRILVENRKL
jgi:hypothetical protein